MAFVVPGLQIIYGFKKPSSSSSDSMQTHAWIYPNTIYCMSLLGLYMCTQEHVYLVILTCTTYIFTNALHVSIVSVLGWDSHSHFHYLLRVCLFSFRLPVASSALFAASNAPLLKISTKGRGAPQFFFQDTTLLTLSLPHSTLFQFFVIVLICCVQICIVNTWFLWHNEWLNFNCLVWDIFRLYFAWMVLWKL